MGVMTFLLFGTFHTLSRYPTLTVGLSPSTSTYFQARVSQVRTERQHMTRDVLPRIGTGFQCFDGKAVTKVMQPRAMRVGVPANACGLKEGVEGFGHGRIAQLGAASRNEGMIEVRPAVRADSD
jgi:hypothetical protein